MSTSWSPMKIIILFSLFLYIYVYKAIFAQVYAPAILFLVSRSELIMAELNGHSDLLIHGDFLAAAHAAYKTRRDFASAMAAASSAWAEAASARAAFHEAEAKLAEMQALMLQQIQDAYVGRAAEAAQEPSAEPGTDDDNKIADSDDSADAAPQDRRKLRRRLSVF